MVLFLWKKYVCSNVISTYLHPGSNLFIFFNWRSYSTYLQIVFIKLAGFVQISLLIILEKVLKFTLFQTLKKVWKIGVSVDKMVKRLDDQVLHKWNVFVLVKIPSGLHVMNKALFLRFFKVSVNHLFDNLESGKRNYCFLEKVLNFGSNESVQTLISTCILVNLINL